MASEPWTHATLALQLLAIDPSLGGIAIRARAGPVRDQLMDHINILPQPIKRLHPGISDEALFGGLDLSATLKKGQLVQEQGLLSLPGTLILTMAERATLNLAARLAVTLDTSKNHTLIALDEGAL